MRLLENTLRMFWFHVGPRAVALKKRGNWKHPKKQHTLPFEDD